MAGSLACAAAHASPSIPSRDLAPAQHVPASSRTRRLHGALVLGGVACAVYSTRRQADALGVTLQALPLGGKALSCSMTPTQARAIAQALHCAAAAAELTQQRGQQ